MKVYVDELPKSCNDCSFECDCFCCINRSYVIDDYFQDTKHKDCPLHSITDYTKQVRKEVVKEFREKLKNNIYLTRDRKHWIAYQDDLLELLDQIEQGERNAKD